ncbi:MAG: AbrB/MazE/SpoVT family DNA-binding domain-containing protein [Clostridiales bacterium]|nr:AbrB/MazE/SpoVT family DNA-binding domain-containing protein [Clostridiales bacterium]
MIAQVKSWGNSQGIRLPKDVLDMVDIRVNDFLSVDVVDGNIILRKTVKHRTLEERAAEFDGKIGPYHEYGWDKPVGRERW